MADFNKLLRTARTVVFGIVCVLSLADFAIACHIPFSDRWLSSQPLPHILRLWVW
ncbi:hypothetical protein BKA70DRAFT_1438328 [Coprinopsis sp. MPI-PUGE-AT-0042]|nr:hypothetical protein BKA70DRAFT_1438328 [Coprinopsis sp. MPI-PUGE-AT-0042]